MNVPPIASIGTLAPLLLVGGMLHAAESHSFIDAADAYDLQQYGHCADMLAEVERNGIPLPINGELLHAECLGASGRVDAAVDYLQARLQGDRIDIGALRDRDGVGLDAIRRSPRWSALIARALAVEQARVARLDQPLREELLARANKDQQLRQAVMGAVGNEIARSAWAPVEAVDRDNTAWLKNVVATTGWPTRTRVGRDGAQSAFLLVQHADADPDFQARALVLMHAALVANDVEPADVALLTDRVLLAKGKPQRYGSQFQTGDDGTMRLRPTEDEAGLDARRRTMGLPPLADYKRIMREMYHQPVE